jgi:hypothetical protein
MTHAPRGRGRGRRRGMWSGGACWAPAWAPLNKDPRCTLVKPGGGMSTPFSPSTSIASSRVLPKTGRLSMGVAPRVAPRAMQCALSSRTSPSSASTSMTHTRSGLARGARCLLQGPPLRLSPLRHTAGADRASTLAARAWFGQKESGQQPELARDQVMVRRDDLHMPSLAFALTDPRVIPVDAMPLDTSFHAPTPPSGAGVGPGAWELRLRVCASRRSALSPEPFKPFV